MSTSLVLTSSSPHHEFRFRTVGTRPQFCLSEETASKNQVVFFSVGRLACSPSSLEGIGSTPIFTKSRRQRKRERERGRQVQKVTKSNSFNCCRANVANIRQSIPASIFFVTEKILTPIQDFPFSIERGSNLESRHFLVPARHWP